jgi:hypothetical protein
MLDACKHYGCCDIAQEFSQLLTERDDLLRLLTDCVAALEFIQGLDLLDRSTDPTHPVGCSEWDEAAGVAVEWINRAIPEAKKWL